MVLAIGSVVHVQAATTLTVGGGGGYSTIQAAVTAASTGDTISVAGGTYTEQVTLTAGKNLTIVGAGRDVVTWIAPAKGQCLTGSMSGIPEA